MILLRIPIDFWFIMFLILHKPHKVIPRNVFAIAAIQGLNFHPGASPISSWTLTRCFSPRRAMASRAPRSSDMAENSQSIQKIGHLQ